MEKKIKIMIWLLLISGLLYCVVATHIRVFEKGDYIVRYNIPCDPSLKECFSEKICNESGDNCETNYYSSMQRIKSKLASICGSDISTCPLAETCMDGETDCAITFCNPKTDTCTTNKTDSE